MDYVKNIFKRMDIQQLRAFLLNGTENFEIENITYGEKLRDGSDSIYKRLECLYQDETELDKAVADLSTALTVYEEVYTEIGMKFGARILFQLLHTDDYVNFDKTKQES